MRCLTPPPKKKPQHGSINSLVLCFPSFESELWGQLPFVSILPPLLLFQVFVSSSGKYSELGHPFGYLKASTTLTCVNLFVMPYNYPVLLPLLGKWPAALRHSRLETVCLSVLSLTVCLASRFLKRDGRPESLDCCKWLCWEKRIFTPPLPFFLCSRGGEPTCCQCMFDAAHLLDS